ncbi:MerR family transcriptional regulator [Deinococcus maricopensis]|uniref:Transcriptional regulator, MerR family n=1 Tax=Deinococcus maricopensis (strain DSM 21211 / LMG 22137 / NRRL B-23946 / LB-34) TaxID=709986 RepID=E8U7A4_DEIML|nr:MerR family transcriptional regulator [Deinococcus maricopensis]ADV66943.1 transcriptional regulator, MerR family [Deinococcus maricopensis DSM 21211]
MEGLRIGQVARATGVSVRAIRHYDQLGLLMPGRADNHYRTFHAADIDRVKLIQLFLSVGFTLDEIRRWAPCFQEGSSSTTLEHPLDEVRAFYARKIADVEARMRALELLHAKLQRHVRTLGDHAHDVPVHP